MMPFMEDLLHGTVTPMSGLAIPVCYTPLEHPGDFFTREKEGRNKKELPCVCGDIWGNETELFYEMAQFHNWVGWTPDWARLPRIRTAGRPSTNLSLAGYGAGQMCLNHFRNENMPPAQTYLTLCKLNYAFPFGSATLVDDPWRMRPGGRDRHCEDTANKVSKLIEETKHAQIDALVYVNCRFCEPDISQPIIVHQRHSIREHGTHGHRNRYNIKKACKVFRGKHSCPENIALPLMEIKSEFPAEND